MLVKNALFNKITKQKNKQNEIANIIRNQTYTFLFR